MESGTSNEEDCERRGNCGNWQLKCHICKNYSCFKTGRARGKGNAAEVRVAKLANKSLSGGRSRLRAGSGAVAHAKGDVISGSVLREVKTGYGKPGKKSFTIQRAWLTKITNEAIAEGRMPVLDFHFDETPDDEFWTVINSSVFNDLLAELEELRRDNAINHR